MWITGQFANGNFFFLGAAMIIGAAAWALLRKQTAVSRTTCVMGAVLVAASSTPMPYFFYALWAVALMGFGIASLFSNPRNLRAAASALIFLSIIAVGMEVPYHWEPRVVIAQRDTIYVIGDSITAGIMGGPKDRERGKTWPTQLRAMRGLKIMDLSQPGATLSSALKQQQNFIPPNQHDRSAVILEIGGNDLLGNSDADQFRADLEKLLVTIRPKARSITMLELPLFPFHNGFGMAQRDLTKKYHVSLIPKRCFAAVICAPDSTVDGLHLSPSGHASMSELISKTIGLQDNP